MVIIKKIRCFFGERALITSFMQDFDVVIIGAGAAGMMAGIETAKRGRSTLILDHAKKPGEKIRISGGGRCNFTNLYCAPENFLSQNPHFCKSALSRYTQYDFIDWVVANDIAYHEKTLGQLFCDGKSTQIIDMMTTACADHGAIINMETSINQVTKTDNGFIVKTSKGDYACTSLIVATGGLSIPKMGASGFGYDLAKQFGLNIIPTRAALVPLTFNEDLLVKTKALSGISVNAYVSHEKTSFAEGLLLTHRGLSGPSILQISSYWCEGDPITVNLCPTQDVFQYLRERRQSTPKVTLVNVLSDLLPKRLAEMVVETAHLDGTVADASDKDFQKLVALTNAWEITPNGSEGYRTAEVTLGGVDTDELSSKTMEAKKVSGLYFIGEVVDVTGWLGGYNFQWAWSSGWVAGQVA